MTSILKETEEKVQRDQERPCEQGGRLESFSHKSGAQEPPGAGGGGQDSPLKTLEEACPASTLTLRLVLLASGTMREYIPVILSPKSMVICNSSSRKLIQKVPAFKESH